MPNKPPVVPTKEEIQKHYIDEHKTVEEVAKFLHCRRKTVSRVIKEYGLSRIHRGPKIKIGDTFGYLEVINIEGKLGCIAICKCICGEIRKYKQANLIGTKCKFRSCGCQHAKNQQIAHWHGHGEISVSYWNRLIRCAQKRKLEFSIDVEQAWNLYLEQNRKCNLTGLPINFTSSNAKSIDQLASLDRIDSDKGYTLDNIQWIHKEVNRLKNKYKQNEFIEWCHRVSDHYRRQNP